MSCGGIKDTCPDKTFASCVKYEGNILESGNLDNCDCHSVEEVIEDIVEVVDEIYNEVFPEDFEKGCLDVSKNKEGRYSTLEILQEVVNKLCEDEDTNSSSTDCGCQGLDPCYDGVYTNGLVDFKSDVSTVVVNASTTSWTEFTGVNFTVNHPGTYKVTVEQDASNTSAGDSFKLGIGVSNTEPINNIFNQKVLTPEISSKTSVFVLQGLKKGDILRPKYLKNVGAVTLNNTKVIYEKVA